LYDICVTSTFGRPEPNALQPDKLPLVSLSATVMGLCWLMMTQPLGEELQDSGKLSPPTSSALTPLAEMNSTDVGRVTPEGRLLLSEVNDPP
jgi:hypothetical protein